MYVASCDILSLQKKTKCRTTENFAKKTKCRTTENFAKKTKCRTTKCRIVRHFKKIISFLFSIL
jgi:hypothetical protein